MATRGVRICAVLAQLAAVMSWSNASTRSQSNKMTEPEKQSYTRVLFSRLYSCSRTFQPAAARQLITSATDTWGELIVIKGQCAGGKFSYQLGNSGRDWKVKRPRSDNGLQRTDRSLLSRAAAWCWTAVERGAHFLCPNPQNTLFSRRRDDFLQE